MAEKNEKSLVYVDTSGWYALVDETDPDHRSAREWFEEDETPLITSDYVFDETITLIRTSLGHREAVQFGENLKESTVAQLISVPEGIRREPGRSSQNTTTRFSVSPIVSVLPKWRGWGSKPHLPLKGTLK